MFWRILFFVFFLLSCSSTDFLSEQKEKVNCHQAYWEQLAGWGTDLAFWQFLPEQNYLETRFGYVFVVSSLPTYPPCVVARGENYTPPIYKYNSLVISQDRKELTRQNWVGGYIVALKFTRVGTLVSLFTYELTFESWQRFKPHTAEEAMKYSTLFYRWSNDEKTK